MRSPNGDLTTQYALHESEWLGDVKYDFLVTEICDKITTCIELMQKDGILDSSKTLREIYDEKLHPSKIDLKNQRLWDALSSGEVLDVFQFSTGVGLATAKQVKPQNPTELTSANALMRLMGEKGKERPLDRYCRLKNNFNLWYEEVRKCGLTEEEIKIIEPYYVPNFGVPASQEDLMMVCLDEKIAHFTLQEANAARKIVAKKQIAKVPELKEKFISQCPSRTLGMYVWATTMEPQMSYAFAKPHALAYSFVGIQTLYLATSYPVIYWNCACLIVKAGGADLLNTEELEEDSDEDDNKKKKNKTADYGKISTAIGESRSKDIIILPPDINKSDLIFKPDINRNSIIYGLKGIQRIGDQIIKDIFNNRPFTDIFDFMNKVKVNKTQMVSLIKAGTFDELYPNKNRYEIMNDYLLSVADQKKRITLQNMQMLATKDMIPEKYDLQKRIFFFNKYLKKNKNDIYYNLDNIAYKFYSEHFEDKNLIDIQISNEGGTAKIKQTIWDNIYKKEMDPIRNWMKENQQDILNDLNSRLFNETYEKYALGNISKWEMDSLSFYYHEHELAHLKNIAYGIEDYTTLQNNDVNRILPAKDGGQIILYNIHRIAGTVIDKDKNKSLVTILTPTGVVSVKIWKNQFAKWDKQIFEKDADGTKHVVEKSWFQRGTKLIITGIKRDDTFIPKKYKNTTYPLFEKIIKIDDNGYITNSVTERADEEEVM